MEEMSKKELLDQALKTQFEDVSMGGDGQKKKESVETLQILYNMSMAQDKADLDAEYRESEMVLKEQQAKDEEANKAFEREIKEREMALKESTAANEARIKELEMAIKKSENLMKKIEVGCGVAGVGLTAGGMYLSQKNFEHVYTVDTTTTFVPGSIRALNMTNILKNAQQGIKIMFKHVH